MQIIGKIVDKLLLIWLFFLNRRKKKAGDAFVDFAEINSIIKYWVHLQPQLNIERVLILRAHNGQSHKKLMPVGYKYVSVMANDYRAHFTDVRRTYQNLSQDNEYVAMVADVYQRKQFDVHTEDMNEGVLKKLYLLEGVTYAKWFFLAHNEEELWFATIATSKPAEEFKSNDHNGKILIGIDRIRQIVKPYFK